MPDMTSNPHYQDALRTKAERLAAERLSCIGSPTGITACPDCKEKQDIYADGYLARAAEPVTVSQAGRQEAIKALTWHLEEWEDGQIAWESAEEIEEYFKESEPLVDIVLLAAGFRIEDDE